MLSEIEQVIRPFVGFASVWVFVILIACAPIPVIITIVLTSYICWVVSVADNPMNKKFKRASETVEEIKKITLTVDKAIENLRQTEEILAELIALNNQGLKEKAEKYDNIISSFNPNNKF